MDYNISVFNETYPNIIVRNVSAGDYDGVEDQLVTSISAGKAVADMVNLPVIASGGAGKMEHFTDVFTETKASGGLAASIFHFGEIPIPTLKNYLKEQNIPIR